MDGKKNFSTFDAFNRINLYDRGIRMECHIIAIILPGASDAAGLIDLKPDRFSFARTQAHFARQIDVACREEVIVYVNIERLLAAHDRIRMVLADMMDRLPFPQKRADHRVQMFQFGFGDRETGAGFRLGEFIFFLRRESMVKSFLESAVPFLFATIADIGRLGESAAGLLFVGNTGRKAPAAKLAGPSGTVNAGLAHLKDVTVKAQSTVIEGLAQSAGFFKYQMVTDLFGYGSTVFAEFPCDCLKGHSGIQRMFDYIAAFQI